MSATPRLNRRLTARASIVVVLLAVGALLAGAIRARRAATEGARTPMGAARSSEAAAWTPLVAEAPGWTHHGSETPEAVPLAWEGPQWAPPAVETLEPAPQGSAALEYAGATKGWEELSVAATQIPLTAAPEPPWLAKPDDFSLQVPKALEPAPQGSAALEYPGVTKGWEELSVAATQIPLAAAPEPPWLAKADDRSFSPDVPPERGAPGFAFPETPCVFAEEQGAPATFADAATMIEEGGAFVSGAAGFARGLAGMGTQTPWSGREEAPPATIPETSWENPSGRLRIPPDSAPTTGPPRFAFAADGCVVAGRPMAPAQVATPVEGHGPGGMPTARPRVYVPAPDHALYVEGAGAGGAPAWRDGAHDPRLAWSGPGVYAERPCSFGEEPADETASGAPAERPAVTFPGLAEGSAGESPSQVPPSAEAADDQSVSDWVSGMEANQPPTGPQPPSLVEPPAPPLEEGAPGAGEPKGGELGEDQKLGEAPEETNTELQFLRQQSVLLEPGEYQIDITFQYLIDETDHVLAQITGGALELGELRRRQRLFLVPIELRVGIDEVTQAFVNLPVGWSNSELAFAGREEMEETAGLGDVSAGCTKLFLEGDETCPDVLGTFAFSAPTGEADFVTSLSTPGSSLGSGFWSVMAGVTFIQTYDPVVIFYGGGYRHRFDATFERQYRVEPGEHIFLRLGAGFAVNSRVTFSTSLTRSYLGADRVNGVKVAGGIREPTEIRLAATIAQGEKTKGHGTVRTVEPFVNFGITEDAIDSLIGISWTR